MMSNLFTLSDATLNAAPWTPLVAGLPGNATPLNDAAFEALNDSALEAETEAVEAEAASFDQNSANIEEIYRLHYRRVYGLCLRMTSNSSDAEDLAHDVFVQLFRKLNSFRGESAFTTWLYRITVNQVLMHFRKKSYRSESVTEDGEMPEIVNPASVRPSHTPMVDKIALLAAVEQLPRGYRTVFILHDLEGYEHEEIATMLGISSGTSKSQLHKARLRMRELLMKRTESATEPAAALTPVALAA